MSRGAGAGRAAGLPAVLITPAMIGLAFLVLPLVGLLVRAPWSRTGAILAGSDAWPALRLSLITSTAAAVLALVLGVPLAWFLARPQGRFRSALRALITVPLVLPPVVGGVALFTVLGRSGILGHPLYQLTGFAFPFTPYAVVLSQTFVALPYLVLSVEGALRAADRRYEDAAQTLGARPAVVFWRVTLPLIGPGVAAGAVLAWARALGEFGATITFAGNFPGTTQTMPLAVYLALETDPDAALLLSVLLLAVSIAVLALLRDRWVRQW
ncbi:molybdate ABC transporter permease [Microlunatus endophyticus]|uniref:Molybdenum transport system permease n=1 Tax=Microlunatus endophyticus TaxID=1716077 RepID=A0A917W730_9ACTN|nr:ABC transporter permease [Microlunatus endophyticus]GGL77178.1 molybdate ABC transporter permease [Microlunatus endophyticus]